MIVEFIGTPGAGKTTLLPVVIECLQARGISARSVVEAARPYAQRTLIGAAASRLAPPSLRRPLLWQVFYHLSIAYRLRFFARHSRLIRQVMHIQRRRPIPAEERRHVLHWFFVLVGQYEFLTTNTWPDEALIFDEGFIHRVVQMNASDVEEPDPARITAYVDLLPRPDLVIVPQAPWPVCKARIYRRGLWERFGHKSPAEITRYVANADRSVDIAVGHIKRKGWDVIEVDNSGDDPAPTIAELRGKLAASPALTRRMAGPRQAVQGGVS
jgi:hypothetical protein